MPRASILPSLEGSGPELMLQVTPPRVPRELVLRAALSCTTGALRDVPVLVAEAPAGFGKTSLLIQWRKELQAEGRVVAWVSARAHNDPARLVHCLALAVRVGSGQADFGQASLTFDGDRALEHMTVLLAELLQLAWEMALIIDEVEQLPLASRQLLSYLLHQVLPNVRILLAAHSGSLPDLEKLVAYGHCRCIDDAALRLDLEDALTLARRRLGKTVEPALVARLQAITEGAPLGFQLGLS